MVLRQVGNDTDNLISKFGLLNKSFANIKKDFQSGQGIRSFGNFVSKNDIENFQKFNKEFEKGASFHKAYNANLSKSHTYVQQQAMAIKALHTQQNILQRQRKYGKITEEEYAAQMAATNSQIQAITIQTQTLTLKQQIGEKAAKAWAMAQNMLLNIGLAVGINLIITLVTTLVNRQKELAEKAKEAASSLKEQNESIEEYKNKITELKNALADETISEEDAYNARKQLLGIQDEVVAKYGLQKESIDLVNGSLRENIALLDEASQKEAEKFLRENKSAINNAKKKVESTKSFSKNFSKNSFEGLGELSDQLYKKGFITIRSQHDGTTSFDSNFKGTTDEAIKHYTELYDYINKYRQDNIGVLSETKNGLSNIDKILASVSDKINKINTEDYQNARQLYDSATASMLQTDTNYRNIYKATVDAREEFQSAVANNDEDAINKSLESMAKAKESFETALNNNVIADNGVAEWFDNYYNDFKAESGKYQFKVDITANSNGLKDSVQEALNYFGDQKPTGFEVLNLEVEGSEEAQVAFQSLDALAGQYKTTIEDLIPILEELEIVKIEKKDVDVVAEAVSNTQSNLTKLKEQIDDILKGANLFDKAIESINKGESIDFDSVMSMIEADESLKGKFEETADGYTIALDELINARKRYTKETRTSIQADIEASKQAIKTAEQNIKAIEAKRDAIKNAALQDHGIYTANDIKAIEEYNAAIQVEKEHIDDLNDGISEYTLILGEMERGVSSAELSAQKFSATLDNASKKQSVLKSAMEDMADTGYLSSDTYATLVEMGGNFTDCLEVQNGKLVLNIEKLKELEKQEYLNVVAANELRIAELQLAADNIKSDPTGYLTRILDDKINELKEQNALYNTLAEEIGNVKPDDKKSGSSSNDDPWKDEAQSKISDVEHKYAMEQITYEEYINEIDKINQKYFANNEKYLDDYRKYEETVYNGRKKLAEDFYNEQKNAFEKRVDELEAKITITTNDSVDDQGNKLTVAEKFDYLRDIYDDILFEIDSRINEIVQSGVEGHEDELEQLHKQYEEYLNKKEDIFKDEIDYEIEHIEYLQDKYNDFIDKRIDRYEDEKKAVEDRYDAEIDKIDETIDALKDKNDETQNAINLKKAEQALEKSRQRTRMTYGSDGTIIYKQDDEAIAEAQQKVDDIKFNMLIDSLEKQKEAVETEKDVALAKYDDMIAALNEQKNNQSTYYDSLIDILNAYLNPKATENIDSVWNRVLADKDKVQTNDGSTTVNGETIDTSEVDKGEVRADKVNEQLETTATILEQIAGSADDFVNTILKTLGATSVKDLWVYSSNSVPDGSKMLNEQHDTTQWSASRDNYTINNSNNEQPMSFSFGDINVNSPVGDSYDLAKELRMNLPNAFEKQMYSNLKKY